MNKILKDRDGNDSSKRITGVIIAGAGLLLLLSIGVTSMFHVIADPETAVSVGTTILISGVGLLTAGVIEHLGGAK